MNQDAPGEERTRGPSGLLAGIEVLLFIALALMFLYYGQVAVCVILVGLARLLWLAHDRKRAQ